MGSKIQLVVWVGGIQEGKSLGDIIAYKQVRILRDWDDVRNHAGDFVDEVANLYGPNKAAEYAGKPGWKPIEPGDVLWDDKNGDNVIIHTTVRWWVIFIRNGPVVFLPR